MVNNKPGRPLSRPGEIPTKEKIFSAAIDLFAEKGYAETSMREIARIVDITEGAVYKHFQNKECILDEIFMYFKNEIYNPLPLPPTPSTSIFRDMLVMLPDYLLGNPRMVQISRIMVNELRTDDKIKNYIHESYGSKADDYTESIIKTQIHTGKVKPCDVHSLAILFNNFRFAWVFRTFFLETPNKKNIDEIKNELNKIIDLLEKFFI